MSVTNVEKPANAFRTEVEMAAPVEAWLRHMGSSCIGREVEIGAGIPDLIGGIGEGRLLRNRRRQSRPITNSTQLALLSYCRTMRAEIELRAWAPNGYYELQRRALRPLLESDLIVFRNGRFRSRVEPKDPFERLIAVELKLGDVTRGLAQAYSYRSFADVSYLALPASRVTLVNMERARAIGLGLLAVHFGAVEEAVEPDETSYATTGRRRMASEHTLAASAEASLRAAGSPRPNMMR